MSSRRWVSWLAALLELGAVGVAAWLLTVYARLPILASCLAIAAICWTLFRFGGAYVWGVVFWGFAAAILSAGFWTPETPESYYGLFVIPRGVAVGAVGFLLSLPAGIVFLVTSLKNPSRCGGNCAGCMIVLFTFVIYCTAGSAMRTHRLGPQVVQETRQLLLTLHRLSADIEAIRAKTGQLPKDEAEVVAQRGKPMPPFYHNYCVRYLRVGGSYRLDCSASHFWGRSWDFFPWIFCYYGPDSTKRLQAISF
jgi:hypothetical protein